MYLSEFKKKSSQNSTEKGKQSPWKEVFSLRKFLLAICDYCLQSSLHGFKYVGDYSLPFSDRLFWLIHVSSSLFFSSVVLFNYYKTGALESFEMSFDPKSTPIWDIPFPTILVCPINPIRKSKFDLSQPGNKMKYMHYSKMVCQYKHNFEQNMYNDSIDEDIYSFLQEVVTPCNEFITRCVWSGTEIDCCSIFKLTMTPIGQCYEFNNIPAYLIYKNYSPVPGENDVYDESLEYWDISNANYPNRNGDKWKTVFPFWSESVGELSGLTVDLVQNQTEDQRICSGPLNGFEVKVYSPGQSNEIISGIRLLKGMHTHIIVTPTLIISEENLISVPQDERGCLFQNENSLDYYNIYTEANCYSECYVKKVQQHCDCIPIFFHRTIGHKDYRYCNDAMQPCMITVLGEINDFVLKSRNPKKSCVCDPQCTGLRFAHQAHSQPIVSVDSKPPWEKGHIPASKLNSSRVSIYFRIQQFTSITRRKTASVSDFLGNCGGLLGLLIGFSFMSAFEVFYFIIIQPLVKVIMYVIKIQSQ